MHIAISSKHFYPSLGGSIVYVDVLAQAFTQLGHRVSLITRTQNVENEEDHYSYAVFRKDSYGQLQSLAKQADVLLQVDSSWRDVWPFLLHRVPWFPTIHRGFSNESRGLEEKLRLSCEKLAYRLGHTIAISDCVKSDWGIDGDVIPNPYDERFYYLPSASHERAFHFLFVGRVVRSKGVFDFVEALHLLSIPQDIAQIHVAIVGDGIDLVEMKERAAKLPDNIVVKFLGRQDPSGVAESMQNSRTLVFPTTPEWQEASPLTPLEAAACGCHVIASDSGGTAENLDSASIIYPAGDVSSLVEALNQDLASGQQKDRSCVADFLLSRTALETAAKYVERFESKTRRV